MEDTTLFLAKLIGPIMTLVGLAFVLNTNDLKDMIRHLGENRMLLFITGMVESSAGLAIVLSHNVWQGLAAIIISLLGWLMVLEGSIELLSSKAYVKGLASKASLGALNPIGFLLIIAGLYLAWFGFLA